MPSLAALRRVAQIPHRAQLSPIGLEFGAQCINAVQLASGTPPVLKAHASVPYPVGRAELLRSPQALKAFLKQTLKAGGFSGRKVVTALPSEDVRVLSVTYQVHPGQSDDQAIAKLMQSRVGEDLSQFVIDYMPIRTESGEGDRLALVLLSERSTVIAFLDQLRAAGLYVDALEVGLVSIRRLVTSLIAAGEAPEHVLVVNAGAAETHLTMISGQRLLFEQQVEFGEEALLEQIAVALDTPRDTAREIVFRLGVHPTAQMPAAPDGIDDTMSSNMLLTIVRPIFANLVAELRRAVLFASSETRGGEVGQVYLMGEVARWPGAPELLASLAQMRVTIPRPLPASGDADAESSVMPELIIPTGLALRGYADA